MSQIDPKIRCLYYMFLEEGAIALDTEAFSVYLYAVFENCTVGEDVSPNIAKILAESVLQKVMNGCES